jgi:hypothetical protein
MKRLLLAALVLLSLQWAAPLAHAQSISAVVVSSCGTPPATYVAGYPYPITQDTTGKSCTNGTGGGGYSVANQTAYNGVSNSFSNVPAGCAVTTSAPTYVTGNANPLSCDTAGNQRVYDPTLSAIAQQGVASTGSAAPAQAIYSGINTGGNLTGEVGCGSYAYKHITSATDTVAVQGVTSQTVRVCGLIAHFSGSAAQSVYIENTASINNNCSSTLTQIGALITGNATTPMSDGFYNPRWGGTANTSGNGLCIHSSGTGGVDVEFWYTQY